MAKVAFVFTDSPDKVEIQIAQHFTRARFCQQLSELNDGDVAIFPDGDLNLRDIIDAQVSATIIVVVPGHEFDYDIDEDVTQVDLMILKTDRETLVHRVGEGKPDLINDDEYIDYLEELVQE